MYLRMNEKKTLKMVRDSLENENKIRVHMQRNIFLKSGTAL